MRWLWMTAGLALVLGGCAPTSGVMLAAQPGLAACADLTYRGPDAAGKAVERRITDHKGEPTPFLLGTLISGVTADPSDRVAGEPNPFDALLDCYVGAVDMGDPEKRLLRGHVMVTMLAIYGEFNLGHRRYDNLEDDAALMIRAIENAELSLASGSRLMVQAAQGPDARPETVLTSYGRVDRVVDVLQVAIDVERPSRARAGLSLSNLASAVGSGGGAGIAGPLLDGLRGIRKAAVLEVYGGALRNDARRFLAGLEGRAVTMDDWRAWDRWLDRACRKMAAQGDVSNRCVPPAATLAAYLDQGTPPSRRAVTGPAQPPLAAHGSAPSGATTAPRARSGVWEDARLAGSGPDEMEPVRIASSRRSSCAVVQRVRAALSEQRPAIALIGRCAMA